MGPKVKRENRIENRFRDDLDVSFSKDFKIIVINRLSL